MKKNLLKLLTTFAVLAPVGLNLASCNKEDENSNSNYTPPEVTYDCVAEAAKNPELTVLNFWHAFNNVNLTAAINVVNDFNSIYVNKKDNPICVTQTSYKDYDTLTKQVESSIQGGEKFPDVVSSYPDHVATYNKFNVTVDMNKFQNDEEYKMAEEEFEDFLESYKRESYNYIFTKEDKANYEASLQEEGATYGKGQLLSLPVNKSTEVMYYNKTFFDIFTTGDLSKATLSNGQPATTASFANRFKPKEITVKIAGENDTTIEYKGLPWALKSADGKELKLKHPKDIIPTDPSTWWTWDDVERNGLIIQAITKNHYDIISGKKYNQLFTNGDINANKIQNNGNFSISWDSTSNLFISIANSFNKYSDIVDSGDKMVGKFLFNDPEVIKQYEVLKDLYNKGIFNIPLLMGARNDKYGTTQFVSQNIFMSVGSTAGAALNGQGAFQTGVTVGPVVFNKKDGDHTPKIIQQGTNITMLAKPEFAKLDKSALTSGNAVNAKAFKKQIAAWEFVKYFTSKEGNMEFALGTNYLPTRTSVLESQEYKNLINEKLNTPSVKSEAEAMQVAIDISKTGALFTDRPFPGSSQTRTNIDATFTDMLESSNSVANVINNFHSKESSELQPF